MIVYTRQAAIAQSVVRNIGSVEVTSSILVSSSEMVENKGFSRKLLFEMSLFLLDNRRLSYYLEPMIFF